MPIIPADKAGESYGLVVIGTGMGSLFFLKKHLATRRDNSRILVLERGRMQTHAWQVEHQRNSDIDHTTTYVRQPTEKPWNYTLALGGGTLCWGAQAPRFHPNDFKLRTLYNVGRDWPFSYDDIEHNYLEAEQIMSVAGDDEMSVQYPRSGGYPQPPHRFTRADDLLKAAAPDLHFPYPLARLSRPIGQRPACCASSNCYQCPTDAKFTALNAMQDVLEHPALDICLDTRVTTLDIANGVARGAHFTSGENDYVVSADLIALGANAIHSPHILMRSGVEHPALGRYLHEKIQEFCEVKLDGLDHFTGSSAVSGMNISMLFGEHRASAGGAVIRVESPWPYVLRREYGRWRQVLPLSLLIETEPLADNRVEIGADDRPVVHHGAVSQYGLNGLAYARANLEAVLAPLPVESITFGELADTANHIQGTTRLGADPADSVVDPDLKLYAAPNVVVLGTSVLPTCGSVNPSLTAAALSLRAAERL